MQSVTVVRPAECLTRGPRLHEPQQGHRTVLLQQLNWANCSKYFKGNQGFQSCHFLLCFHNWNQAEANDENHLQYHP